MSYSLFCGVSLGPPFFFRSSTNMRSSKVHEVEVALTVDDTAPVGYTPDFLSARTNKRV